MPVGGLKKRFKKKASGASSSSPSVLSVEQLVERAHACLDELPPNVEGAIEFFERALRLDSNSTIVLDAFGALLCDEGAQERATELFQRSISVDPHGGSDKYFYLAQLVVGQEALVQYERGVEVLAKRISTVKSADGAKTLMPEQSKLASVMASIAEIYMTELCDEPEAEDKCEDAVTRGLEADPNCLELLVAKMALRKVQGLLDESKELGLACLKQMKEASASGDANTVLPSDEVRIALCRALIDLELYEEAREVLLELLEQDEEDIQVWYLLACSHLAEKDKAATKECAKQGLAICKKARGEADDWKEPLKHVLEQAALIPADPEEEEEGEAGDDI